MASLTLTVHYCYCFQRQGSFPDRLFPGGEFADDDQADDGFVVFVVAVVARCSFVAGAATAEFGRVELEIDFGFVDYYYFAVALVVVDAVEIDS